MQFELMLPEWILATGVIFSTLVAVTLTRAFLANLHKDKGWEVVRELAPAISSLVYVIGFQIFMDIAPLHGRLEAWLNHIIYVFSIVIYLRIIQKAALLGIEWSSLKSDSAATLRQGFLPLVRNLITLFVFFSGAIMILKHFNYDVMSLLTALGVGSLAVGLAAKDTLSNMISGFILIVDRNLRPGDRVNLTGSVGDVHEIGLRSTQIRMTDGNTLIVPNADLVNTKILNLSLPNREISCSVFVRVPYSVPFPNVKSIALNLTDQIGRISKQRPSWANLVSLSEGHQLIQIGFWVSELIDTGSTISEFHERLLDKFRQDGIPLLPPATQPPTSGGNPST